MMAGYGDELIRSGLARGAAARGKRIAFGRKDMKALMWGPHSHEVFKGNPNVAQPGTEHDADVEWIEDYKGHRLYCTPGGKGFVWNTSFNPQPGELYFDEIEKVAGAIHGDGFVVMEPNLPRKIVAPNKEWPRARFEQLAARLAREVGLRVVQFRAPLHDQAYHGGRFIQLGDAVIIPTRSFRDAAAILAHAAVYVGHEGGMHHCAAAVGVRGVVLMGGFIHPGAVGYRGHVNLTGGSRACGSIKPCQHCREAMDRITVDQVFDATMGIINDGRANPLTSNAAARSKP